MIRHRRGPLAPDDDGLNETSTVHTNLVVASVFLLLRHCASQNILETSVPISGVRRPMSCVLFTDGLDLGDSHHAYLLAGVGLRNCHDDGRVLCTAWRLRTTATPSRLLQSALPHARAITLDPRNNSGRDRAHHGHALHENSRCHHSILHRSATLFQVPRSRAVDSRAGRHCSPVLWGSMVLRIWPGLWATRNDESPRHVWLPEWRLRGSDRSQSSLGRIMVAVVFVFVFIVESLQPGQLHTALITELAEKLGK